MESALLEHPAVEESAVVASPDVDRGQVVKAFIVLARSHHKIKGRGFCLLVARRVGKPNPTFLVA